MTVRIQGAADKRVVVSGFDLTEYLEKTSNFSTPMGRFLDGPGIGRMEKLINAPPIPLDNAGMKKHTAKKGPKGSMVAEISQSNFGTRGE